MAEARNNKRRRSAAAAEPNKELVSHLANFLKKRKLKQQANKLYANNTNETTTTSNANRKNAPPRTLLFADVSTTTNDDSPTRGTISNRGADRLKITMTETTSHAATKAGVVDATPSDCSGDEDDTPTVVIGSQDDYCATLCSNDSGAGDIALQVKETQYTTTSSIEAVMAPKRKEPPPAKRPNRVSLSPQQNDDDT